MSVLIECQMPNGLKNFKKKNGMVKYLFFEACHAQFWQGEYPKRPVTDVWAEGMD